MPSQTQRTWRAKAEARRAARGPAAEVLARAGLTARGIIYLLIGLVAILVAVGQSGKEADQAGALKLLAGQPFGLVALWLLGLGFAAYALWRLSEAAFGVTGEGYGAGPRLKSAARAVIYAGFAVLTFDIIAGTGGSQAHREQDWSAEGHAPARRPLAGRDHRPGRGHRGHCADHRGRAGQVHAAARDLTDEHEEPGPW